MNFPEIISYLHSGRSYEYCGVLIAFLPNFFGVEILQDYCMNFPEIILLLLFECMNNMES